MKSLGARATVVYVSIIVTTLLVTHISYAKIDRSAIVGIWLFDEGKGGVAKDSSGKGHDGQVPGGIAWVQGKWGNALKFSGSSGDYVKVPHSDALSLTTWTITVWVNLQKKDWQLIVQKSISGDKNNNNYSLYTKPDGSIDFNFIPQGGNAQLLNGKKVVVDEKWHHVATTFDGKIMILYIDGVVDGQTVTGEKPQLHTDPLVIGGDDRGAGVQVKGLVDEVGLFNKAFPEEDIKSIMTNGLGPVAAVSQKDKLSTTWGSIKAR